MFSLCMMIVVAGITTTFEDSNEPKAGLGIDPIVAKCSSICSADHQCYFFGNDKSGICQTFKTFDSEVEYRLYARKPAVTINITASPYGSRYPASIELVGKGASVKAYNRGLHVVQLNPSLNKVEKQKRLDVYGFGHHIVNYVNGLKNGAIALGATRDDATASLNIAFMKTHGMDFSAIRFRQPYAFLMQKGYPNKSILVIRRSNTGKLVLSARIYRPCFTSDPTHYVFAHGHDLDEA